MPRQAKRLARVQLFVCLGCCCGRTDRGHPEVPVDWLKAEWKRRGLRDWAHLTISGCLGPCEQTNVAMIATAFGAQSFSDLATTADYDALLQQVGRIAETGALLPPLRVLAPHALTRFTPPAHDAALR